MSLPRLNIRLQPMLIVLRSSSLQSVPGHVQNMLRNTAASNSTHACLPIYPCLAGVFPSRHETL